MSICLLPAAAAAESESEDELKSSRGEDLGCSKSSVAKFWAANKEAMRAWNALGFLYYLWNSSATKAAGAWWFAGAHAAGENTRERANEGGSRAGGEGTRFLQSRVSVANGVKRATRTLARVLSLHYNGETMMQWSLLPNKLRLQTNWDANCDTAIQTGTQTGMQTAKLRCHAMRLHTTAIMPGIQLRCNALQTGMITGMQTAS